MKAGESKTVTHDVRVLDGCAPIRDGWGLKRSLRHEVGDGDASLEHPEGRRGRWYEKPVRDRDPGKHGHARSQDECG